MAGRIRSRSVSALAALLTVGLVLTSTAGVDAKRPPKPPPTPAPTTAPPPSGSITIAIAPSGTLEPTMVYAFVDVTVTCPVGWTWSHGWFNVLQNDRGGSGSFSVSCTGTPQVARAKAVNGNRFSLGNWSATAYVQIVRNGQELRADSSRIIRLEPGVVARVADQGQLTGTSGGGVRIAVAVACPTGAIGQESSVTVSQGTASGRAFFTPICDRITRTVVLPIAASQGTFRTGSAVGEASVAVGWNSGSFSGVDSRGITVLDSSTGDTTPPTTPGNLSANVFGDGETWLDWAASGDNATPSGLIVYEVYLNDRFDQPIGGGFTEAILYADLGVVSTIEVIAVDGAGNKSAPAIVTVDCSQGWCQ
jgi:hypothetical protein